MSCPFGFKKDVHEGALRSDIRAAIINKKVTACPIAVRLAWHASGTYDKSDKTGGSDGATMRFVPESTDGANAGLNIMRDMLQPVKRKHPEVSIADIWTYAGVVAVEESGGPTIPFAFGRTDAKDKTACPPNGRLPDAAQGAKHLRDVFYRQGFNDQEIVALSGAHTMGSCHKTRSGFDGPWTSNPLKFDNEYFKFLLDKTWVERKWDGPLQYADKESGKYMMLPTDIALIKDDKFLPWVKKYAEDQDLFFNDFAAAYTKLLHNGAKKAKPTPFTEKEKISHDFREYCMHGSTERAKALASKADVHAVQPGSKRSALHKAAYWGHDEIVRFLVEDLKLDVNLQDSAGDTALMDACKFGHSNVIKTLLKAGAKTDITNENGQTALKLAEAQGKSSIVAMLM